MLTSTLDDQSLYKSDQFDLRSNRTEYVKVKLGYTIYVQRGQRGWGHMTSGYDMRCGTD